MQTMPADLTADELSLFQYLAYETAGIRISDHKYELVQNRLRPRLKACACENFTEYHRYISSPDKTSERQRWLYRSTHDKRNLFLSSQISLGLSRLKNNTTLDRIA